MKLNVAKIKELSITFLLNGAPVDRLTVYSQPLDLVSSCKLLGINVSADLKWSTLSYICAKASKRFYVLRTIEHIGVQPTDLRSLYGYLIRALLKYACPV